MCRTGMCLFGIGNWIFLSVCLHLFTYAQGGEDLDYGVRFTTEPSDGVILPGEGALLSCAASARHPIRLSWRHSASATPTRDHGITISDKYRKQLSNGSLSIEKMSGALAGQYQCVATVDGIGTIVSRVATIFLAEVPEVRGGPRSVAGVAGGAALLPCGIRAPPRLALRLVPPAAGDAPPDRRVYGAAKHYNPPPTLKLNVTWLKNGSPVVLESARVSVSASGALELDPLTQHDAARYACRLALHSHEHAHQHHHLYKTSEETELRVSPELANTESPPRFIATPQPVTVMEGASVTFDCAAVGNPKPEIIWLNNGVAIDLSDLDSRFYLVGSGSLRVQWARALDAGAYTCRAHNRLDSADHTTHLHVLTSPRVSVAAAGGVVAARARGDVTLACEVRGKPAPVLAWLKDGDPLTPNNHDIALVDGTSLRIQGVLRVDAGMFQCSATSPAGAAAATLRLLVLPTDTDLDIITNNTTPKLNPTPEPGTTPSKTNQDIFNTLISSNGDQTVEIGAEDSDFLGETSSAYTSEPIDEYDDLYDDNDYNNSFHATEGLDPDELRTGNASIVSAPRGLRAVIVKHRFVTLTWEEPEHKAEDITGYAIIYKVKGSERERVSRGAAQRHEMNVAALQPNTTYQFHARAYTHRAVSPPTPMIEVLTTEEEVTHGPPAWVRAVPAGPHALRVSWAPPAPLDPGAARSQGPHTTDQPPPTKYTVYYTEVESSRSQVQVVESTSWCVVAGLRAATLYAVRVAAAGGAPSPPLHVRTPSDAPNAAPLNVTAVATGATSILVRWEAPPARAHRGPLTGYKVRYRAAPAAPAGTAAGSAAPAAPPRRKADSLTTPADVRRAELRGLDTATTYQIRVCAINANGSGPFSEWVPASTQPQHLAESVVPPQPPPLTTRAGRDWISVWWSDEGGGAGGVVVRGYVLGWGLGVPDEVSRDLPATTHSHVIRGLESNSEYVISLRASNSLGQGPAVYATVRTRGLPDPDQDLDPEQDEDEDPDEEDEDDQDDAPPLIPPVGLKVIMLSGSTAVVYWTDPTLPKGQTATDGRRYVVRWAAPGGRPRTFNATDLNCMLDDLRPYTLYEFAVKLIKGGRESSWSMLVSNTTLEAAPGGAPRDVRAAPAAPPARAVDLVWDKPAKPNGIITGYVIMYSIVGRSSGSSSSSSSSSTEEWTALAVAGERGRARVDRLRPRTTYNFKVQARNNKGLGPFSQIVTYTTALESGGGAGLAGATSAWLWASAGGACAVLALAAALALSLCCRRATPPLSPDTSTYQKSSASAAIKPPDLWIHHDQMELKHMDKSLHSSAISAGSVDGGSALVSSTLTLGRAPAEYEPAPPRHAPPASLDRRHYVPTYVESRSPSCAGSDDTAVLRASPASLPASTSTSTTCRRCDRCEYKPMTGVGVGVGVGVGGVGCASTCERRQHNRMPHPDQSTPLLAGVSSPQCSLASLHAPAPAPAPPSSMPCGSGTCPLGASCAGPGPGPVLGMGPAGMGPAVMGPGGDIYACAARERGHYVAYEPLGHYTHRDSLSSEGGVNAPGAGSLRRGVGAGPGNVSGASGSAPQGPGPAAGLHSFALDTASDHSTPTHSHSHSHSHSRGSVRETSPYKKSASSSPGHIPNRLQLGGSVGHCPSELEPLTPSRSTERLHREMQNLEGLMKDLSAITQHQFHC